MTVREVNTREIAEALGRSKCCVFGWAERRDSNGMPAPIRFERSPGGGPKSPIYDLDAIIEWFEKFSKAEAIPEGWVSPKEAGEIIGIHETTVREFMRERPDFPRPKTFKPTHSRHKKYMLNREEIIDWKENIYVPGEKGKMVISSDFMPENLEYDPRAARMFLTMPFMSVALKQEFPEIEDYA